MRRLAVGLSVLILTAGCGGGGGADPCRLVRVENDRDADGAADDVATVTYSADGLTARTETDLGANGVADMIRTEIRDAARRVIREEEDLDADGILDLTRTRSYDAAGNLVGLETVSAGGTDIRAFTYDAAGRETRADYDSDGDGAFDAADIFVRDAAGTLVRIEGDDGLDGTIERVTTFTYLGPTTTEDFDIDNDGDPDRTEIRTFDPAGRLVRE
ncbi:MAG: hypothetical protein L0206_13165, partial [Actinobacteria bacterium]|nr:hypothetical protein [Actinomycetota bacterium]